MKERLSRWCLATCVVAFGWSGIARATCPDFVHFLHYAEDDVWQVWSTYEQGALVEKARFANNGFNYPIPAGDYLYFHKVATVHPTGQRWQLYRNDTLVGDFYIYNKPLVFVKVEGGTFYFYRTYTQGLYNWWELYRFVPFASGPELVRTFHFLKNQQPTLEGFDGGHLWFTRCSIMHPFILCKLYEDNALSRTIYLPLLAPPYGNFVDDGHLYTVQLVRQDTRDVWRLYRDGALLRECFFSGQQPDFLGIRGDHMYFYLEETNCAQTVWSIFEDCALSCSFIVTDLPLWLSFDGGLNPG